MSEIVGAVLPAVSYSVDAKLRELASATNENLMELIRRSNPATLLASTKLNEDGTSGAAAGGDAFNIASMIIVLTLQVPSVRV